MQLDHIIPRDHAKSLDKIRENYGLESDFAIESYQNLVPAHSGCNRLKSVTLVTPSPAALFTFQQVRQRTIDLRKKLRKIERDLDKAGVTDYSLTPRDAQMFAARDRSATNLSRLPYLHESSTGFFSGRFTLAFPGVRGIEWFERKDAIIRLQALLKKPLIFRLRRPDRGWIKPIWWWRDGELQIDSSVLLNDETLLLNSMELVIDRVAAVHSLSYPHLFVYVITKPSEPTGIYDIPMLTKDTERFGYSYEEFAVFRGRHVTREHYDDGATVIDGKLTQLKDEAELRVRYLTPYNFVIAAHNSPINNGAFDRRRRKLLDGMLTGDCNIEELATEISRLELNRLMDYEC